MRVSRINRRDFLKRSCIAGAAFAAGTAFSSALPLRLMAAPLAGGNAVQETRLLMGTIVTINAVASSRSKGEDAVAAAFAETDRLIAVFDRFSSASALGVLNADGALAGSPPELCSVLTAALTLGRQTGDAFNPAVTPVVELFSAGKVWGAMPAPKALADALELAQPGNIAVNGSTIRLARPGMRLTLDGIAKGYIADAAAHVLSRCGVPDHLVNAGGDIRAGGMSEKGLPWVVGIENPARTGGVVETVAVGREGSAGIATSGGYESFYDQSRRHHHLISHRTGASPAIASVTVKASTAVQADGLATALALMPPAEALRFVHAYTGAECLILGNQGQRYISKGWG